MEQETVEATNFIFIEAESIPEAVSQLLNAIAPDKTSIPLGASLAEDLKFLNEVVSGGKNYILGTDVDGVMTINDLISHLIGQLRDDLVDQMKQVFSIFPNADCRFIMTSRPLSRLWMGARNWLNDLHEVVNGGEKNKVSQVISLAVDYSSGTRRYIPSQARLIVTDAGKDILGLFARILTSILHTPVDRLKDTFKNLVNPTQYIDLLENILPEKNSLKDIPHEDFALGYRKIFLYFDNDRSNLKTFEALAREYSEVKFIYFSISNKSLLSVSQEKEWLQLGGLLYKQHFKNALTSLATLLGLI